MIKAFIAALSLSTLCIPQVEAQAFTETDLLEYHAEIGGRVYVDSDACKDPRIMGMKQGVSIHICAKNAEGDAAEIADTIRHEVWHMVQACNGGPITSNQVMVMGEAYAKGWTGEGYKADEWHLEAEAHFAAATFTPQEIKNALAKFCFD
jgi:hypothetical protein